jgi:acyl-CoA reductase-like NAD-dependent aldehyde dehydrogenase
MLFRARAVMRDRVLRIGRRQVSFTGSTEDAKDVMKEAAPRILKSTMDLAAKSLHRITGLRRRKTAKGLLPGARITRQGQSCSSVPRLHPQEHL